METDACAAAHDLEEQRKSQAYVEAQRLAYAQELRRDAAGALKGKTVKSRRPQCPLARVNVLRCVGKGYDFIVYTALVALDMYSEEEEGEVSVVLPSRRVRGWYLLFGLVTLMLAALMMVAPTETLRFFGWQDVDTTATRLLAASLAAHALMCIRSANYRMLSYHVLVADSAALLCASFVVAIISVAVSVSHALDVAHVVTLGVVMGMGFAWMYCRGLTSASAYDRAL